MKKRMKKFGLKRIGSKQKGFTLIELLIVLTILAILVAVVTLALTSFIGKGEEEACSADADALQIAALAYYHDNSNTWPANGLALISGGYIDKEPDSDTDCGWGIGLLDGDLSKNRICYYADAVSLAAAACDCTDDLPPCETTLPANFIELSPWVAP